MSRSLAIAPSILLVSITAHGADEAKGMKVESTIYSDYYVKNNSGLKSNDSYLVITSADGFDKVFELRPPALVGKKSLTLPNDTFEKRLVTAVIKQGKSITNYTIDKVSVDGDTLYIQYKATAGKATTAIFASPLIITTEKGAVKKAVFIENEKTVASVDVK
jgi:hypothetical protein